MKTVLLVEDSDADVDFIKRACEASDIPHVLHVVRDGEEAVDYLAGNNEYANRAFYPLPDLVFLDVKMPKLNGHEVLEWVRAQVPFKTLPVIMLTGSDEFADINRAYELGVTSYLVKTLYSTEFRQNVRIILKFWLELNRTVPAAEVTPFV
jgi:CheY-like chemotaxis protein